ncbi:hypothetical protein EJJ20_16830 [Pseudomonas poae]|uniref:hypothetical protein n=1 Tax=Pseudomonas cremoris TaxID=2724178 RepID=UPI000F7CF9C1|nr:hypothetical protein [Pseudomonas cremoris]AZP71369.1 hypothetical protein EJJ20_16830 [Pseudomonas poae]
MSRLAKFRRLNQPNAQQSMDDVALQETFETALRKLLGEYNMNLGDVVSILDLSRIAKTVSTKRTVRRA